MTTRDDEAWATDALTATAAPAVGDWEGVRTRLGQRAAAEAAYDVAFESHDTPYGPLLVAATDAGIVRLALSAEEPEAVLGQLAVRLSPKIWRAPTALIAAARTQLDEYFDGARRDFDVPLDRALSVGFRRAILDATSAIPYGSTASYSQVAASAGSPKAVRAAGTALATNPIPIIVPCHRVLRADGVVGNYLGGTDMKTALLQLERAT